MKKQRNYLLTGYLGANNLGDECMLRRFLELFVPFPEVTFTIFSYGLNYDSPRIATRYHSDDAPKRWLELQRAARDADGIIWVGGNCFTDFDGDGEFRLLVRSKLAGKRFYYVGVGLDDMRRPSRRLKAKLALNLADGVIVRDQFSLDLGRRWSIAGSKIAYGPDLGELYLQQRGWRDPCGEPAAIVASWRNLEKNLAGGHRVVIERLAGELALLSRETAREIVVFHTDDRMDREANRYLVQALRENGVKRLTFHEQLSLEEKLDLLAGAWTVVTARLHAGVAAVCYGKPCAIFNYSKKVEEFASRAGAKVLPMSGPEDFALLGEFCRQGAGGKALQGPPALLDDGVYLRLAAALAGQEESER